MQGWAPVGLDGRGRKQARALGRRLADRSVDRIVASDLRRTRETTALLRETGGGPEPTFRRAWRERDVGVFQGLTREAVFEGHPQYAASTGVMGVRATPEGGESLLDLRERVLGAWERLRAETAAGETALVVTHGGPIYVLLGEFKRMALPAAITDHSQDNCGLTELRVGDEVHVLREDETGEARS